MPVAQYVIARYCPAPSTGEAVNVGVIVHCPEIGYLNFKFLPHFTKVRTLFGMADANALDGYIADFLLPSLTETQANPEERNLLFDLAERFNGNLQFTPPRATSAQDLDADLQSLFNTLVAWRAGPRQRVRSITNTMLKAWVKEELSDYIGRNILQPGPRLGSWSNPDFRIAADRHEDMVYVQSLAKGSGAEIKGYAEQLAGNVFLTRRRLHRPRTEFFAIIHPPTRADQREFYRDCLNIIHESEAQTYEYSHLNTFRTQVLDRVGAGA